MAERSHSLRGLLLLRLWLPLLSLILAGAVASYALASHFAGQVFDRWLGDSATSLTAVVRQPEEGGALRLPQGTVDMLKWDTVDRIYVQVVSGEGQLLFGDPIPAPAREMDDGDFYDILYHGRRLRVAQVRETLHRGAAPVTIRVAETRNKRRLLRRRLLLATAPLQAGIATLAGLLLWSGTAAGARAAQEAAKRLAAYDAADLEPFPARIPGPRELQPAFDAITGLIGRVARSQQAQQRFVANAAHQLRTPLAAMQIQLESALRETDPQARQEALHHTLAGLTRLRHVTRQMLTLNRSSASSEHALGLRRLDLSALAREEVERHADRAIQAGIDLGYEGPDAGIDILGEAQLLREALANLIDNALQYGRPHGIVTVAVRPSPPTLCVDDDGPGIPESERERVVERFYRAADHGDGSGLGLAIVAEIAARHRAGLRIEASPAGGARIVLEFPPAAASSPA